MANIFVSSVQLSAADADGVCQSQTPISAGSLTLNGSLVSGGVATLDSGGFPRQLLFDCTGDHTGVTYTVYGRLREGGDIVSEEVAGVNGTTTTSVNFWYQVTQIDNSAAPPDAVVVGTNEVGSSKDIMTTRSVNATCIALQCQIGGTVNYTLQWTASNLYDKSVEPLWTDDATVATKAADFGAILAYVPAAFRVKINSGTGSVATTVSQVGRS